MRKGTLIGSYRDETEPDITSQGPAGDSSDTDVQLGNHDPPSKIRSQFYTRLNCISFSLSALVCIQTRRYVYLFTHRKWPNLRRKKKKKKNLYVSVVAITRIQFA